MHKCIYIQLENMGLNENTVLKISFLIITFIRDKIHSIQVIEIEAIILYGTTNDNLFFNGYEQRRAVHYVRLILVFRLEVAPL
jgi:hypothetical protein